MHFHPVVGYQKIGVGKKNSCLYDGSGADGEAVLDEYGGEGGDLAGVEASVPRLHPLHHEAAPVRLSLHQVPPPILENTIKGTVGQDFQSKTKKRLLMSLRDANYYLLYTTPGVTKKCRLSCLTNSALVIGVQMQGEGGSCGVPANEYSCAHHVTLSLDKLRRSTSLFNLWFSFRKK